MARSGPVHSWRFPLIYASSHPPTFLAVTLADVKYAERPPLVLISLKRPDGKQLRIYRHTVRGPREGESGPFLRYGQTPLRVQLSTDEATVTAVQNFLADEFDLRLDGAQIGGRVDRFLFGVPTGDSEEAFAPLTGDYEIIVQAAMRDEGDSVGKVRFVVGGAVFGLMGTDSLGRDLARGLLFGLPVALFIGIIAALMSTAIGTSLGIASGYLGGRADITIQRISDIVANVPVLPLLIFMLFIVGPSLWMIIFILVIFGWPGLTIQIRSMVLHVRTNQLVEAIQSLGASRAAGDVPPYPAPDHPLRLRPTHLRRPRRDSVRSGPQLSRPRRSLHPHLGTDTRGWLPHRRHLSWLLVVDRASRSLHRHYRPHLHAAWIGN